MLVTLLVNLTEGKLLQPIKVSSAISVTLDGITIALLKPLQSLNAALPIEVTLFEIVIEVKPLQPEKADLPIVASFIVTEVREGLLFMN